MANRTVKDAKSIRGTNPQYLVEKIIRSRIYDSKYWKEECFALTAELLVDKAMELRYLGGVHGGFIYPTPFLCLLLKMLQIQPEKDIVVEFIKNEEFKYVRALGAFYMRLTGTSLDCYKYLEPLYNDNRKLRRQNRDGQYELIHMDEYIDELLREERLCDVILPRIQKRHILEENNELEPKVSALDDDLDEDVPSDEEIVDTETKENRKEKDRRDRDRRRDRSRDRERRDKDRKRERSRSRDRDRRWERERERERDRERVRDRERDREKERRERHEVDRRRDRGRY
ncbi:pre-mRNA-splicing factor 38 [Nymphalis io]|uniref:pre-mRNA-splicing factor 38 n=1 Tax=Inachis io TaxID=171585 RepID=UPI002168FB84|nr:pre-mRNA-splicing factor 38 [Nymphalis io]